jgi:hypothetical protein
VEIVLGVSMTPTAARLVLVEGREADGLTVDHRTLEAGQPASAPEQVLAAVLGTRESAADEGHRLVLTGVAWSDHAAAARLAGALREHRVEDVVLVSELHAAGALAQAIGRTTGAAHTGLVLVEPNAATLAVVRTDDAAVVRVATRSLHAADARAELQDLLAPLAGLAEPPEAIFMVGSGVDVTALRAGIAAATTIPVFAPADGELALARGAALAAATAPVFDAATVAAPFNPADPFAPTAPAARAWGDPAPTAYGFGDDVDPAVTGQEPADRSAARRELMLFPLAGGAVATLLVLGVVALVLAVAVSLSPGPDPAPCPTGGVALQSPSPAPETIPAPVPVVQQAPRTVVVTAVQAPAPVPPAALPAPPVPAAPRIPASAPAPAAPPAPAPVPAAPAPAAPAPAPAAPAPVPVTIPIPVVIPQFPVPPILAPLLTPQVRTPVAPDTATTSVTAEPEPTPAPVEQPAPTADTAPQAGPADAAPASEPLLTPAADPAE